MRRRLGSFDLVRHPGAVMLIMTVEVDLLALAWSVVTHLGWPVRDSPVLKVVSCVATTGRDFNVGILCIKTGDTGVSR